MKKHTTTALLAAALLCLGAFSLTACTNETPVGSETTGNTVESGTEADTPAATEADTVPETEGETEFESESESETETVAETETVSETEAESETTAETAPPAETEPETVLPRYDYMEAEVSKDVTIQKSDYDGITLTLPADLQITDGDVLDYIEYIRFDYRTATNGSTQVTDQALKLGDDAYIYYKGMIDGVEFNGGSNWDDASPYALGLGSGSFIPGFEEGLVGVIPASATKETPAEVHVTFPENYSADLAGKDAVFYVAVMYAVQYELPEYNRAFVENTLQYEAEKDFYASDRAYLTEFEGFIRTYLEEEIAADVENAKLDALWTHLTETAGFQNLPQMELDYYYASMVAEIEYYYDYYVSYYGAEFTAEYPDLDAFAAAYTGSGEGETWKDVLNTRCELLVKKDMAMHAIAEAEGMETVTDEDYKAELAYWVEYYQGYMTEAEIVESMGETYLREAAFAAKMQDWLMEKVTFTFETADETPAE